MTGFQGADTDQLREQSTTTSTSARTLSVVVTAALAMSQQVSWVGPDADAFRTGCDEARRRLLELVETLQQKAEELLDHADQQDDASDPSQGSGLPFGPFGPIVPANPFGPGGPFAPFKDLNPFNDGFTPPFGPIGPVKPLNPFGPSGPFGGLNPFDDGFKAPFGPIQSPIPIPESHWDVADRAWRWGQEVGGKAWDEGGDWISKNSDWLKKSKILDYGRKGVPILPDLYGIGKAASEGDAEAVLWKSNRAAFEALPGLTVADLIGGEFTSRLGDEHTVFDSDIKWNAGTPMDGIEEYMTQKTRELNITEPGEQLGEGIADRHGMDSGLGRNLLKSGMGIGVSQTIGGPAAWAFDQVTPGDVRSSSYKFLQDNLT